MSYHIMHSIVLLSLLFLASANGSGISAAIPVHASYIRTDRSGQLSTPDTVLHDTVPRFKNKQFPVRSLFEKPITINTRVAKPIVDIVHDVTGIQPDLNLVSSVKEDEHNSITSEGDLTEGNGANPIVERDPVMIKDLVDGDQAGNANPIEERDPVMIEDPVDITVHITPAPEETMNFFTTPEELIAV